MAGARVCVGGGERGRWEMSVMKCEICLWRRWGACEDVGNQEGCDEREGNDIGDVCVGLQAFVFQPVVTSLPHDSYESFVEDHLAKIV